MQSHGRPQPTTGIAPWSCRNRPVRSAAPAERPRGSRRNVPAARCGQSNPHEGTAPAAWLQRAERPAPKPRPDHASVQYRGNKSDRHQDHARRTRSKLLPRGRSHTKPGSMLKSRIAMRTWADHDEDTPGFVEVDLVAHEGGNASGRFCFTLTVTDIATGTGWTENRTGPDKRQGGVVAAITDVVTHLLFPIKGIDSENGSEFINAQLYRYCHAHKLKFTRSRSGNKNDGAHVEQKNWTTVRQLVGYLRYDTEAELELLNRIWVLQSLIGNHFYPQQKLISKVRHGAKITKKYDRARTPYVRAGAHPAVTALRRRRLTPNTPRSTRPPCNARSRPPATNC